MHSHFFEFGQNLAITHAPLVLAIIIPKPLCFPSSGYVLQSRTATVPFHHGALPPRLLRASRFDSSQRIFENRHSIESPSTILIILTASEPAFSSPSTFNLIDPVERNTIGVPNGGWTAIRFRADNPGIDFNAALLKIVIPLCFLT